VAWANGNAWAPCIEEKFIGGKWKYFFYFSGDNPALGKKALGVAVSSSPVGPFIANSKPLFTTSNAGQMIDSDVFTDPVSGKSYLYYGNGNLCYRLLSDDMMSVKGEEHNITPVGGSLSDYAFREGTYVFYRKGIYYFLWSVDDTGSKNYHVAYGTSTSPEGPITVASQPIVIIQNAALGIYGTGHNSIVNIPGTDDWYIIYHRINKSFLGNGPGYHREVCCDKLTFDAKGNINKVTPTRVGISPVDLSKLRKSHITNSHR
jgi:arabinoxylan arabinofuranohydrolase